MRLKGTGPPLLRAHLTLDNSMPGPHRLQGAQSPDLSLNSCCLQSPVSQVTSQAWKNVSQTLPHSKFIALFAKHKQTNNILSIIPTITECKHLRHSEAKLIFTLGRKYHFTD